jgi:hypothetical protein
VGQVIKHVVRRRRVAVQDVLDVRQERRRVAFDGYKFRLRPYVQRDGVAFLNDFLFAGNKSDLVNFVAAVAKRAVQQNVQRTHRIEVILRVRRHFVAVHVANGF